MPKTIRNEYYKKLTYQSLMKAHLESKKGKSLRKEIILFNMKQEEYIMWLYEKTKSKTSNQANKTRQNNKQGSSQIPSRSSRLYKNSQCIHIKK